MTLFIACILIYGLKLDSSLYFWASMLWVGHLFAHSRPGKSSIKEVVAEALREHRK